MISLYLDYNERKKITDMKKRTVVIGALVSLLPIGQPLVIGTGAALTSTAVMLAAPESAKAETWNCEYIWNGEIKKFVRYREGNQFNSSSGLYKILDENEDKIHLYKTFSGMNNLFAISLDKKQRKFSMVALSPGNDSKIISGSCEIKY